MAPADPSSSRLHVRPRAPLTEEELRKKTRSLHSEAPKTSRTLGKRRKLFQLFFKHGGFHRSRCFWQQRFVQPVEPGKNGSQSHDTWTCGFLQNMEGDRPPQKVITYIFWYQQLILTVAHMIFGCGTWKWGLPPVVAIKSFGKWWTTIFWGTLYGTPRSNKPKHVYNVYQPKTTFYVILWRVVRLGWHRAH